jgi:hypothetical protein
VVSGVPDVNVYEPALVERPRHDDGLDRMPHADFLCGSDAGLGRCGSGQLAGKAECQRCRDQGDEQSISADGARAGHVGRRSERVVWREFHEASGSGVDAPASRQAGVRELLSFG